MPGRRLPALDGVRAVAIGCVLCGHSIAALPPAWRPPGWLPMPYGNFGVQVFFVLSGFLITGLLVERREPLRAFYRRRAYRILPAYAVMLAVAAFFVTWRQWVSAATFSWNYSPWAGGWTLGHTWSLAVEEQFYLLWPLLLLALGRNRARRALLAFVALAPVIRLATWYLLPATRGQIGAMFHTRGDALAVGCLLALGLPRIERLHWLAVGYLPVSWSLAHHLGNQWLLPFGYSLDALAIAVLIAYVTVHPPRWLTSRVVVHVGLVSYSLYLWQQWFLRPGLLPVPLAIPLAFAAAEVSYRLVERPALTLRQRREQAVAVGGRVVHVRRDADRVAADAHVDALGREGLAEPVG